MAQRFWPGLDAVGQKLPGIGPESTTVAIVGVVEDVDDRGFGQEPGPVLYLPFAQFYEAFPWQPRTTVLVLRTEGAPEATAPSLVAAAAEVDPNLPLFGVESLRSHLAHSFALERFLTTLLLCQGVLTLLLAGAGLHGLLSFTTARRSRELAVRITLGADAGDLRRLVYVQSLRLVGVGLVAGFVLSIFLGRSLSGLLFGVDPVDSATSLLVIILVGLLGVVAPRGPLRQVLATDPSDSLRTE